MVFHSMGVTLCAGWTSPTCRNNIITRNIVFAVDMRSKLCPNVGMGILSIQLHTQTYMHTEMAILFTMVYFHSAAKLLLLP